jgi:hypothetical protein
MTSITPSTAILTAREMQYFKLHHVSAYEIFVGASVHIRYIDLSTSIYLTGVAYNLIYGSLLAV